MGNQQYKINYQQLSQKDKIRLQQGLPVDVKPGVSITYNKKTGKLEGVPKEWADGYQLPINFDQTKTKKYNKLPQQVRPAQTLPDNILELINSQPIIIGSPKNFKHLIHLEIDVNSPMGIKGLPNQWLQKLKMAGLNKEQIQQSPQIVKILKFKSKQFFKKIYQGFNLFQIQKIFFFFKFKHILKDWLLQYELIKKEEAYLEILTYNIRNIIFINYYFTYFNFNFENESKNIYGSEKSEQIVVLSKNRKPYGKGLLGIRESKFQHRQ